MNPWKLALPALIVGPFTYLITVWVLKHYPNLWRNLMKRHNIMDAIGPAPKDRATVERERLARDAQRTADASGKAMAVFNLNCYGWTPVIREADSFKGENRMILGPFQPQQAIYD